MDTRSRSLRTFGRIARLALALAVLASLGAAIPVLAAPSGQAAGAPVVGVYGVRPQAGTMLGGQVMSAYVQVLAPVEGAVGRTAVLGLPGSAFSVTENGKAAQASVQAVSPDEPLALVVIADTANDRRWLQGGAKYTDPLQYLREAAGAALRQFPENGRFALYTMNPDGVAPLADRTTATNAAAQLADRGGQARLLQRLDEAVAALKEMPPEWRRVVLVLSDGNSRFGRPYEAVREAALEANVVVFGVGTVDPDQPYSFLGKLAQDTGGYFWSFEKAALQPQPTSPILLEALTGEAVKAIRSAYRLELRPSSGGSEQRTLAVTVKTPAGEARAQRTFQAALGGGWLTPRTLLAGGALLLLGAGAIALAAGYGPAGRRPVRTDYYLIGRGPTAVHFPEEEYLFTGWRSLGRGGRGYRLPPENPHYLGISRTHVYLRVKNLRKVRAGGVEQTVGEIEVRAGSRGSKRGINTAYVYNDLTGPRLLSERPYELQKGDLLILQGFAHGSAEETPDGIPAGVRFELGYVANTDVAGGSTSIEDASPALPPPPRVEESDALARVR